jgi:hypothetical protein
MSGNGALQGEPFAKALYLGFAWNHDASGFNYTVGKCDVGKPLYCRAANRGNDREMFGEGFRPDTWFTPAMSIRNANGSFIVTARDAFMPPSITGYRPSG